MIRNLVYWFAVLTVSLALVVGLILLIESRDRASLGDVPPALSLA